jgi:hypothetical protein
VAFGFHLVSSSTPGPGWLGRRLSGLVHLPLKRGTVHNPKTKAQMIHGRGNPADCLAQTLLRLRVVKILLNRRQQFPQFHTQACISASVPLTSQVRSSHVRTNAAPIVLCRKKCTVVAVVHVFFSPHQRMVTQSLRSRHGQKETYP